MNEVALRANDVLRNDVGLRPMMLRFAMKSALRQKMEADLISSEAKSKISSELARISSRVARFH